MKFNLDRILIASGFIGPIIFFFSIYFLFPFFYPGYDIINQTISELGAADSPIRVLTNVFGFSLFGIFLMLFALGIFRSKEINNLGKFSAFFIFITGIMMYLTGIFYGESNVGYTIIDKLHIIVSNYQFPILAFGLVVYALSVSMHKKIMWLTPFILFFGIITLSLAYVFFFTHDLQNRGIWQRASIGLPYAILMTIAISLYRVQFRK